MMPRGILPNFVVDTTLWTLLYSLNKGCCKKKTYFLNFVFEISMLKRSRILKILVPTPHNTPIIMWAQTSILKIQDRLSIEVAKTKI